MLRCEYFTRDGVKTSLEKLRNELKSKDNPKSFTLYEPGVRDTYLNSHRNYYVNFSDYSLLEAVISRHFGTKLEPDP